MLLVRLKAHLGLAPVNTADTLAPMSISLSPAGLRRGARAKTRPRYKRMSVEKRGVPIMEKCFAGLSEFEASRDFNLGSPHQLFYRTVSRVRAEKCEHSS